MRSFLEQIGKRPITMKKEIDGFIAARLQAAITREAMCDPPLCSMRYAAAVVVLVLRCAVMWL